MPGAARKGSAHTPAWSTRLGDDEFLGNRRGNIFLPSPRREPRLRRGTVGACHQLEKPVRERAARALQLLQLGLRVPASLNGVGTLCYSAARAHFISAGAASC